MSGVIEGTCRTQATLFPDRLDDYLTEENNYTPKKLQFHIARVEKHIDEYLKQLDDSDQEDEKVIDDTPIKDKIDWLKKRHSELKALEEEVNSHPAGFSIDENPGDGQICLLQRTKCG